jgi:hypothetical protein
MKRIVIISALVAGVTVLAFAAEFWTRKPYQQWSREEAVRVLTDSPWAKTVTLRNGTVSTRTTSGAQGVEDSRAEATIWYTVSIRSALPVRQANARLAAINQKYDKMDAAAKKDFDEKWSKYLDNKFDMLVFAVNYDSNDPSLQRPISTAFQAQTVESMKPTTFLTLKDGTRLEPVGFAAGPREMQIAFARPATLPQDASFIFEFMHPTVTNQAAQRIAAKFSLKDMAFNGAPAL